MWNILWSHIWHDTFFGFIKALLDQALRQKLSKSPKMCEAFFIKCQIWFHTLRFLLCCKCANVGELLSFQDLPSNFISPCLVAAVLNITSTDVTFFCCIFHLPWRDLMEEQCSNWVAGGIQITHNPQWAEEGQMLHEWLWNHPSHFPLNSDIYRVRHAERFKDQPFSCCTLVPFPFSLLLFHKNLLTPIKITSARESFMSEQLF